MLCPIPSRFIFLLYCCYLKRTLAFSYLTMTMTSNSNTASSFGPSKRSSTVESFKVMDVLQRANQLESQGRTIYHCEVGQPASGAPKNVANAAVSALNGTPDESRMGYTDAVSLWLSLLLVFVHLDVHKLHSSFPFSLVCYNYVKRYQSITKQSISLPCLNIELILTV